MDRRGVAEQRERCVASDRPDRAVTMRASRAQRGFVTRRAETRQGLRAAKPSRARSRPTGGRPSSSSERRHRPCDHPSVGRDRPNSLSRSRPEASRISNSSCRVIRPSAIAVRYAAAPRGPVRESTTASCAPFASTDRRGHPANIIAAEVHASTPKLSGIRRRATAATDHVRKRSRTPSAITLSTIVSPRRATISGDVTSGQRPRGFR